MLDTPRTQFEYEYAVMNRHTGRVIMRTSSHRNCVEFLAASDLATDYVTDDHVIARRHVSSTIWQTDWQED